MERKLTKEEMKQIMLEMDKNKGRFSDSDNIIINNEEKEQAMKLFFKEED